MDGTLKIRAAAADVGEYAVQHDPHAKLMRRGAQGGKIVLRAEHRVDALIIIRVVAVIRPRHKNRVEIQDLHAQLPQIRQLLADAVQVAAVKIVVQHLAVRIRLPDWHILAVFMHPVGLQFILTVALPGGGEAVGEDLIHHRAAQRLGHGKGGVHAADLPEVSRLHICVVPLLIQAEGLVFRGHAEVVKIQPRRRDGKRPAPGLIQRVRLLFCKRQALQLALLFIKQQHLHRNGADADGKHHMERAVLPRREHAEGAFELRELAVI